MLVGVPKEIKVNEFRVGLTPASVREFAARGHKVVVESGAGTGIGATDSHYTRAGAEIAETARDVFDCSDMIVKVKEPQASEWAQLRPGQILFTYLHLAPDRAQTEGLVKSGCTAVAYETVTDAMGALPLLAPMSEVAGRLSIEAAAASLRRDNGGRGMLIGGVPGVEPVSVTVIGGGVVGTHAARMAAGLGARVVVLERSLSRLRQLDELFAGRICTRFSTLEAVEQEIATADVVIGAVLVPGSSAPRVITRSMLQLMKPNSVLVDVAIDQGGCFETSRPTTHRDPTYVVDDVIHYCVANMPGAVPVTSSHALNNATLPYGLALADGGLRSLIENPHLRAGVNVHHGAITHPAVARALDLPYLPADEALSA